MWKYQNYDGIINESGMRTKSAPPRDRVSPALTTVGSITGSPFMNEPFLDPRSLYIYTPFVFLTSVP